MDERTVGRRETDGGNIFDNAMPWQFKVVGFVGVPSAIALFLVWNLVDVNKALAKSVSDMSTISTSIGDASKAVTSHAIESREQGQRLERYLQLICVNTAKSDLDRTNCFGR